MSEQAPKFDENEFLEAIKGSFDAPWTGRNEIQIPPGSESEVSGRDEASDIM